MAGWHARPDEPDDTNDPWGIGIGIDVGGTKIAAGIVGLRDGHVFTQTRIPTNPERGGLPVLDDVVAIATHLKTEAENHGNPIVSVGVGVAEIVDPAGQVVTGNRIVWPGLPVWERLSEIAPARIESDVRSAALAEARFGAGRPYATFAYVTIGTGISYTLVVDGHPIPGARGAALVLASGPVAAVCPACGHRHVSVLEEIASGPALAAGYARATGQTVTGAETVLAAAADGDPVATGIINAAADSLANTIGLLVNILDPASLVIGGGLGLAGGLYRDRLIAGTRAHIWNPAARDLPILPAALGADVGLIGAALAGANGEPRGHEALDRKEVV